MPPPRREPDMPAPPFQSAWIVDGDWAGAAGDPDALFPWWSFTKTVLAVAALRLVEMGRLDLDTPRPSRPYTLRHLLLHRAGVPNYGRLTAYHEAVARGEEAWPRDRLLAALGGDRLDFAPGSGWAYSNVGYMLVGDAIAAAAGLPLADALSQLVLAPLGLSSAGLATERDDFSAVFWPGQRDYDPRWVYHGCLIGTAADAVRLLDAVLHGELLAPEIVKTMVERSTPQAAPLPGRPWTAAAYALGLMANRAGELGRAIGHSGAGPGSVNAVYHFPDLARPMTVAAFAEGENEGLVEHEACAIARSLGGGAARH